MLEETATQVLLELVTHEARPVGGCNSASNGGVTALAEACCAFLERTRQRDPSYLAIASFDTDSERVSLSEGERTILTTVFVGDELRERKLLRFVARSLYGGPPGPATV